MLEQNDEILDDRKDVVLTVSGQCGYEECEGSLRRLFTCPNAVNNTCTISDGVFRQFVGYGWIMPFNHLANCLGGIDCLRQRYLETKIRQQQLGITVEEPPLPPRWIKKLNKERLEKEMEKERLKSRRKRKRRKVVKEEIKESSDPAGEPKDHEALDPSKEEEAVAAATLGPSEEVEAGRRWKKPSFSRHLPRNTRSSFEHVLMNGAKNEHDAKRRKIFKEQHQTLLETEYEQPLNARPVNPFGPNKYPDNNVFAEDMRMYGILDKNRRTRDYNIQASAWPPPISRHGPNKANRFYVDNKEWDIEHGDTINSIAFCKARLSQVPPKENERDLIDGSNLVIDTTDVGFTEPQVPRALLLHCWERAVHAASCNILAPKFANEDIMISGNATMNELFENKTAINPFPRDCSLYEAEQRKAASVPTTTNTKMSLLGFPDLNSTICPRCSASFEHPQQACQHFYGSRKVTGCCWRMIRDNHHYLIDNALQRHIAEQSQLIMNIVVSKGNEKMAGIRRGKSEVRLLNWYDILKYMESTLESSKRVEADGYSTANSHPILETIKTNKEGNPMMLNPAIMEAVKRRLIDRYADVAP